MGGDPGGGRMAQGQAYTDGALSGTLPRTNRAGWSYVVDDGVSLHWGEYGPCDETYASVVRAELRALVELLRISTGPLIIHVDNKAVVDGVSSGREWCCDPRREGADLWRQIWDRLDDLEGLMQVVKIKAHLTYDDVLAQRIEYRHWIGNALADKYAKAGAKCAAEMSPVASVTAQWHRAVEWYRWAFHVAAEWFEDTVPSGPLMPPELPQPKQPTLPSASHEVWRAGEWGWCRRCGAHGKWTEGHSAPVTLRSSCKGTIAERAGLPEGIPTGTQPQVDDGFYSFGFLRSKGAARWNMPSPPQEERSGYARSVVDELAIASLRQPVHTAHADAVVPSLSPYLEETHFRSRQSGDVEAPEEAVFSPFQPLAREAEFEEVDPLTTARETRVGGVMRRGAAHASHQLRQSAHVVWCRLCGHFASLRIGVGLTRACPGVAKGVYASRLKRLKLMQHPVTAQPL